MPEQQQREIARKGGRAAHAQGTAHEFTKEEAAEAGRKGGQARSANNAARAASRLNEEILRQSEADVSNMNP